MSWAKIDDGLHDHPKVDALLEHDELRGAAALGLWVAALSYSTGQLTDGVISARAVRRLCPEHGPDLAALLVEHGLWDATATGWRIHDYLDFNPSREEVLARRERDAARKSNGRKVAAAKRNHDAVPPPVRPDVRVDSTRPSGRPDPTRPDPTLPPNPPQGGNRRRDRDAFDEEMTAWASEHFPGVAAGYVTTAVSDLRRAALTPTVENIRPLVEKWTGVACQA